MNYLDVTINNKRYVQRAEFSKIIIYKNDKKESVIDNIEQLSALEQEIMKEAINIAEKPEQFFKYQTYADDDKAIYITDYIGKFTKNVVIPPYIDGKIVYGIDKIFQNNLDIERVMLPDTIEQIFPETFSDMPNLKLVQLPSKIKELPYGFFANCEKLKYVNLENINIIKEYALNNCKSLEYVCLKNVSYIQQFAFAKCKKLKSISLPNINKMDRYVFDECINLETATLSDGLDRIEQGLFCKCKKLKEINLPNNTKNIGIMAFYKCKNLTSIIFPDKLLTIAPSAFDESGLEGELILPKNLSRIGQNCFINTAIKKVKISKNTRYAEDTFSLDALLNIETYEEENIGQQKDIKDKINFR